MSQSDTIYALATAPGKSGVAVMRISGPRALAALKTLTSLPSPVARHAHYVTLRSHEKILDRGIAIYFNAPHSFTGEDVVELHIHGSLAVIQELLAVLGALDGLRPAEAGEFTRRAFINGKMDLLEAEGLADLIEAQTSKQKSQALAQMQGELSGFYEHLRAKTIHNLALLEAYIDFPDEEIPESVLAELTADIQSLQKEIQSALSEKRGERMRDGLNIVILGAPNVGKSSLLNAIAGRDAAIVSHRAGTTRDLIEIHMDMAGYPVVFVDTAGIRETSDDIEEEGVRRALARAQNADVTLVLFDGGAWPAQDAHTLALMDERAIKVINKCDLFCHPERSEGSPASGWGSFGKPQDDGMLFISTKTGEGIEVLLAEIEKRIVGFFASDSAPFITRNRHRALLSEANMLLAQSMENKPLELKCEELRRAALAVGKITGKIQVDDVLDVVFKRFCIGK